MRRAEIPQESTRKAKKLLRWLVGSPPRLAVSSFASVILIGTVLLCVPLSSSERQWTHPVDALFTATSGVCVTGLTVKDMAVYWSLFGQVVILILIQSGGLGIMTLSAFLAVLVRRRRFSMGAEKTMQGVVQAEPLQDVWGLVKFICLFTLAAETLGWAALLVAWRPDFESFWKCAYFSIFHVVSAFCNAGFSLFSDNLVHYRGHVLVNLLICSLIVVGGIGFTVVKELIDYADWWLFSRRGKRQRLSTHCKLVLTVTGLLLLGGFAGVYLLESGSSLQGLPMKEKLLASVFQSVTPRTAGFNTMLMSASALAPATILLLIVLMFVGGSPGGTAGGIKTSTLGVMIASVIATLRGKGRAEMFSHAVPNETIHRVSTILLLSGSTLLLGIFILLVTEKMASFAEVAFECTSAFGTVGLSLGITPGLTMWGKLVIASLMFVGRVGPVTLMLGAVRIVARVPYSYPEGSIMVG